MQNINQFNVEIKILGTGCTKCKTLEKITIDMVREMELEANVTMEEDIMKIMEYGIIRTPGLVIDEKLVLSGRIPSKGELKKLLTL
jgi:small redox-active disulfide protein 2